MALGSKMIVSTQREEAGAMMGSPFARQASYRFIELSVGAEIQFDVQPDAACKLGSFPESSKDGVWVSGSREHSSRHPLFAAGVRHAADYGFICLNLRISKHSQSS